MHVLRSLGPTRSKIHINKEQSDITFLLDVDSFYLYFYVIYKERRTTVPGTCIPLTPGIEPAFSRLHGIRYNHWTTKVVEADGFARNLGII